MLIKSLAKGVLTVLVVIGVAVFVAHLAGSHRLNAPRSVTVRPVAVAVATGQDALARGKRLASISACAECHGDDLSGKDFIDGAPIGFIATSNLTAGQGGIAGRYSDEDWERAIRHGIAPDGRTLVIMPSDHYAHYADEDLGVLIAYLKSLPPVDHDPGSRRIDFPGTIIFGLLAYSNWPANTIDHDQVGGRAPEAVASVGYGEYLSSIAGCKACHGHDLQGQENEGGLPGPDLTPTGPLADWSEAQFAAAVRTGLTPDMRVLSPDMPWRRYTIMNDSEIGALWRYIRSLPPQAAPDTGKGR